MINSTPVQSLLFIKFSVENMERAPKCLPNPPPSRPREWKHSERQLCISGSLGASSALTSQQVTHVIPPLCKAFGMRCTRDPLACSLDKDGVQSAAQAEVGPHYKWNTRIRESTPGRPSCKYEIQKKKLNICYVKGNLNKSWIFKSWCIMFSPNFLLTFWFSTQILSFCHLNFLAVPNYKKY